MLVHRLRHIITFQELVTTGQDAVTGELTQEWQTVWLDSDTVLADVPAEVLTGPGREVLAAGATQAETAARINLRWFPGLSPAWRILWDGRIYNITTYDTDATGRKEWRLRCSGGLTDGR